MLKVEFLKLGFGTLLLRYYLLMLIVIGALFSGSALVGLLALPVFLSNILGVTLKVGNDKKVANVVAIKDKSNLNAA